MQNRQDSREKETRAYRQSRRVTANEEFRTQHRRSAAQRKHNNVNSCTLVKERYLGVTWRSTKRRDRLFRDCDKVTPLYSFFVRTVYRTRVILSRYGKEF